MFFFRWKILKSKKAKWIPIRKQSNTIYEAVLKATGTSPCYGKLSGYTNLLAGFNQFERYIQFLELDHFPHVGIKQMINQNKKSVKPPAIVIQWLFFGQKKRASPHHIQTKINHPSTKIHRKTDLCPLPQMFSSWWFQPIWKICSSNWIISPIFRDENYKNVWVATNPYCRYQPWKSMVGSDVFPTKIVPF